MGFIGRCPIAGVLWQHIHYIVGLQQLGHDVFYIEDSARIPYNPTTFTEGEDYRHAAEVLDRTSREFGFEDRWAYRPRYLGRRESVGLPYDRIAEIYRNADAILNICGSTELNEELLVSERLIYVESDPGVEQIKIDKGVNGSSDFLRRHRKLFTFGENVGSENFSVPLHGLEWLPTRQPIVTGLWKPATPQLPRRVFTSVANWNTKGRKDVEWRGEIYLWDKSHQFRKFIEAPMQAGEVFELATGVRDSKTRALFNAKNWRLIFPHQLSNDLHRYRSYLQRSKGEFTVAKDQYVRLNTGWFSDRSASYLAAGRPVITQETGFSDHIETGRGLFSFRKLEEVSESVQAINSDYEKHCRGAREIAMEYFEATKVLASLLDRAGI
jgi:hypothetical protein